MDEYLRDSISIEKDVEGLCHLYRSNLYRNKRALDADGTQKSILPCTPLALIKILESEKVRMRRCDESGRGGAELGDTDEERHCERARETE